MIHKSFKSCGITVATDGSEDDQIVCVRPDGQVPEAADLLAERRLLDELDYLEVREELDPEQDEENGYINEDDALSDHSDEL